MLWELLVTFTQLIIHAYVKNNKSEVKEKRPIIHIKS